MVEHARSIVEDEAIYLTNRNNYLQWMSQWMMYGNKRRHNEAQRPPRKLGWCSYVSDFSLPLRVSKTYGSYSLHAQHERIRSEIPRVR